MTVGKNIRRIRKAKGLTQKELGKMCSINEVQIRQYELEKANPKIETIEKIANALNVPVTQLAENISFLDGNAPLNRWISGTEGLVSILQDIYGQAEEKTATRITGAKTEGITYYFVGNKYDGFVIDGDDFDFLYEFIKTSLPPIIDRIKNSKPEDKAIEDIFDKLQDMDNEWEDE